MQQLIVLQLSTVEKIILATLILAIVFILRSIYIEYQEVKEIEARITADQERIIQKKEQISTLYP